MNKAFLDVAFTDIETTIKTLDQITDNTKFRELQIEITSSIHNAVHAIVDCYERMEKDTLQPEEDMLFRAFMYLNNQLKHDENLQFITYNVSGSMFPIMFPFKSGSPAVYWASFKDNGNKNARGRRCHYEQMLMNKDVRRKLEEVKRIFNKYRD